MADGVELLQQWEAVSTSDSSGEVRELPADVHSHAVERPVAVEPGVQSAVRMRGLAGWWKLDGWKGVAVVALMLVGGFGLWRMASPVAIGQPER
jgi:hypothetical protein